MRGPSNDTAEIDTRLQELKEIAADMREVIDAGYGDEMFEPGETHWLDQIEYAEEDDSIPTTIKTAPTYYYADDEEEEDAYDAYDKLLDAYFDDDLYD